jgi:hypothetical protein|tara:strand:- start:609 stop:920 length:312 start_codon:yes stop_codon:yes gene_type:complete
MAFASNKNAYGICDITGFRYKHKDLKKTWDGLLVGKDQWNAKHPQLMPKPSPIDPQAIRDARPDTNETNNIFMVYSNVGVGKLGAELTSFELTASIGAVTITT